MNTHATSLKHVELSSLQLQAVPDLSPTLAFLAGLTDPDIDTIRVLGLHIEQLDANLTDDPLGGLDSYWARADSPQDLAARVATVRLLTRAGAEGLDTPPDVSGLPMPPRKRRLTVIETVWLRVVAIESGPRQVALLGAFEAGASQGELANLAPDALTLEDDRAWLDLPGDRDRAARRVELPVWAVEALHRLNLAARWLLHDSRSDSSKNRECTLLMATKDLLDRADLLWRDQVSAASIGRSSLTQLALDGPAGWERAVAASGHHNPRVTERLLRLAEPW